MADNLTCEPDPIWNFCRSHKQKYTLCVPFPPVRAEPAGRPCWCGSAEAQTVHHEAWGHPFSTTLPVPDDGLLDVEKMAIHHPVIAERFFGGNTMRRVIDCSCGLTGMTADDWERHYAAT
jgi:hypothetical protein